MAHPDPVEEEIIDRVIEDILKAGFMISIHDSDTYSIRRSTDHAAIAAAIAAADETTLVAETLDRHRVAWVWFVLGNGRDVIADCTPSIEDLIFPTERN